jgi:hypothetical protein
MDEAMKKLKQQRPEIDPTEELLECIKTYFGDEE